MGHYRSAGFNPGNKQERRGVYSRASLSTKLTTPVFLNNLLETGEAMSVDYKCIRMLMLYIILKYIYIILVRFLFFIMNKATDQIWMTVLCHDKLMDTKDAPVSDN